MTIVIVYNTGHKFLETKKLFTGCFSKTDKPLLKKFNWKISILDSPNEIMIFIKIEKKLFYDSKSWVAEGSLAIQTCSTNYKFKAFNKFAPLLNLRQKEF